MTNHGRPYRRRLLLVAAFALGAGNPAAAGAQSAAPPPSIQAAMQHMYGGDPRGAATILEALTKADPRNVRAWSLLALSYRQSGDLERARATYDKALALNPKSADAMFNLAGVWALEGENDSAFAWLAKAKASRNYDMTQLEVDTAYASLRHDPRYASMLPTAKDFADPFVEHATIIREFDGDSTGDQFGWIARSLGDVDHDGMEDFVTSAPTKAIGGENAGRVYVYSSGTGMLLWSADGTPGSQLGTGVESAGDVDGDGMQDVVAGAPYAGRAYVFSGKDGHLLLTLTGERASDAFGSTVAGFSDSARTLLVVGAPSAGAGKVGRTYVYDRLSTTPKFIIESDATGRALGAMFVSVPGDVNGDGVPDVYASDFTNAAKGASTGRIYVHSGRDGHLLKTITDRIPGDTFGFDAVGIGDVDHDGTVDLLLTAAWSGVHGNHSGRIFIVSSGVK